jgi:TolB protein
MPAGARPPGTNGQIVFGRFDPNQGDTVTYTINPDGSHEKQVRPEATECPDWSPDGTRIVVCGDASGAWIINPDDGTYRVVPNPDPANLFLGCSVWSPDGLRLTCEVFGLSDPSRNGIYTIRSTDGGVLTRMTNPGPGGDDILGGYSPDGHRFVFARHDAANDSVGLFVTNVNKTGLRQITPTGTLFSSGGDWSPQGNEIVFSEHVTSDVRSSIWVVHADGTGLHEISVQGQPACGGAFSDPSSVGCFDPSWSPDGKKIVFARGTSGDFDSNVYTINADGTGLTQVTHGTSGEVPDWGTHPLAH